MIDKASTHNVSTYNRDKVLNELVKVYAQDGIDLTAIYLSKHYEDEYISNNKTEYGLEVCMDLDCCALASTGIHLARDTLLPQLLAARA